NRACLAYWRPWGRGFVRSCCCSSGKSDMSQAVPSSTDIFVIGGGPAGLAAAITARQRGFRVVVADGSKPPIDKACGEALMPDAIVALGKLGVTLSAADACSVRGVRFLGSGLSA